MVVATAQANGTVAPDHLSEKLLADRLSRWRDRLSNLTDLLLPTDYPRPLPIRSIEEIETLQLSESTLLAILQLSLAITIPQQEAPANESHNGRQASHPTPFTILLAAFAVLLQRFTGDEDFTVGSSSASREPLVLRLKVNPMDTFHQVVKMVHEVSFLCL